MCARRVVQCRAMAAFHAPLPQRCIGPTLTRISFRRRLFRASGPILSLERRSSSKPCLGSVTLPAIGGVSSTDAAATGPPLADFLYRKQRIGPGTIPESFDMWVFGRVPRFLPRWKSDRHLPCSAIWRAVTEHKVLQRFESARSKFRLLMTAWPHEWNTKYGAFLLGGT